MAKGNSIVLSAAPRGVHSEGTVNGAAVQPGMLLQLDVSAGLDSDGRPHYELYAGGTGLRSPLIVADIGFRGGIASTVYADNDRIRVYYPLPGDELNVLVKTGQVLTFGALLISETATGLVLLTTGTPETEPFISLEAQTTSGSELVHVLCTGV